MSARLARVIARVQGPPTMPTHIGDEIDQMIHAADWDQRPRMADMARLSAGLASALGPTPAFTRTTRETIRGRGLRGRRRVLLAKRQLPLQIRDALRLLGNLTFAFGEFPSQTLYFLFQALVVVRPRPSLGARHAVYGTPIGSICTAP
jgi:hypothetical protein